MAAPQAREAPTLQNLRRDVSFAVRLLTKDWTFTFILLSVLSLGIGVAKAVWVFGHAVGQREQELIMRLALGARRTDIAGAVGGHAAIQLAVGITAGIAATWGFERAIRLGADAFGYRMSDPITLSMAAGLLAMVTAVACHRPAYRATRLDPARAL